MNDGSPTFAGFWRRFAAFSIDWTVLLFVTHPLYWQLRLFLQWTLLGHDDYYLSSDHMRAEIYAYFMYTLIFPVVAWCYMSGMETSPFRGTIGKLAVGLYVVDVRGNRVSFGRATARHFGRILSVLTLMLGYLMAGWTPKKQALHDMLSGCLVLRK